MITTHVTNPFTAAASQKYPLLLPTVTAEHLDMSDNAVEHTASLRGSLQPLHVRAWWRELVSATSAPLCDTSLPPSNSHHIEAPWKSSMNSTTNASAERAKGNGGCELRPEADSVHSCHVTPRSKQVDVDSEEAPSEGTDLAPPVLGVLTRYRTTGHSIGVFRNK